MSTLQNDLAVQFPVQFSGAAQRGQRGPDLPDRESGEFRRPPERVGQPAVVREDRPQRGDDPPLFRRDAHAAPPFRSV